MVEERYVQKVVDAVVHVIVHVVVTPVFPCQLGQLLFFMSLSEAGP